ncbi:MAG: hypothetical protein ACREO0_05490 [Pseudoxanthomonas sp.]
MTLSERRVATLPSLQLLGEGLDAIVIHTATPRRWWEYFFRPNSYVPFLPGAAERLRRYETAACLFPLYTDPRKAELRLQVGAQWLQAWKEGKRPRLMRIYEQMPLIKQRRLRVVQ